MNDIDGFGCDTGFTITKGENMTRRKAQCVSSQPGVTPVTYQPGWILGWGISQVTADAFVIWEDGNSKYVQTLPLTPNTFAFLDGQPDPLPVIE